MPPFSAQLRVAGHVFPIHHCAYRTSQPTDVRSRVVAKVQHHAVDLLLDVPDHYFLLAWAADPHKRLPADIVFLDPTNGSATESLHLPAAYCVDYHEHFISGDAGTGAYWCGLTLSDPGGFTMHVGVHTPAFVAPAAGSHGTPVVATLVPAAVPGSPPSDCSPAMTALLQKQVELMCKPKGISSKCFETDACSLLLQKIAMTEACIEARRAINNQCFKGGDFGHQQAMLERQNGIRRCEALYLRQCGSKPPVPAPAPSTDAVPSKQPDDGKYGPTTLAGAALIIFFILTAPFRTAPN